MLNQKYNHCSICGKQLSFWAYLQFWQRIKVCSACEPKNLV